MSARKRNFNVTLTQPYGDRLDRLVEKGIDFSHTSAIRSALRMYFKHHGMPLTIEEVEG